MNDHQLKNLAERVKKLETVVFGSQKIKKPSILKIQNDFKGATGGIRLLISKGFFNQKRTFGEITGELGKNGYHYSLQAIQTPLNNLSKSGGLLVSLKNNGKKVYAKRK